MDGTGDRLTPGGDLAGEAMGLAETMLDMATSGVGDLEIGPLRARPGTTVRGWLPVGELPDGTPVRVPLALIHGVRPGKTLYLQAVSDGDELNGLAVVREVLGRVRPEELSGSIVAVPVLN